MVDRLSGLTEKQKSAFQQFKENIRDVMSDHHDDQYLCKWMMARNFHVPEAEDMYRKHLEWRRKNRIDHILEEWAPPAVCRKYYAGGLCGFDKDGFPIAYNLVSYMDFKGLYYAVKKKDICNMNIHASEAIQKIFQAQTNKLGKRIDQVTILCDLEHLTMKHLSKAGVDTFLDVMKTSSDNYPEHMRRFIIIRAPRIFPFAFSLIRPFLTDEQKRKIVVLGGDWKSRLLEMIDADQLPVYWGGTMTDPDGDPKCSSKICFGGEVPKSLYLTNQDLHYDENEVSKMRVSAMSDFKVTLEVTAPGSVIKWEFKTVGYDIKFGVYQAKEKDSLDIKSMECLIEMDRVNSQCPQDGSLTCDIPATYVLVFDNSYSWFHSKELSYYVEIVPPASKEDTVVDNSYL